MECHIHPLKLLQPIPAILAVQKLPTKGRSLSHGPFLNFSTLSTLMERLKLMTSYLRRSIDNDRNKPTDDKLPPKLGAPFSSSTFSHPLPYPSLFFSLTSHSISSPLMSLS